MFGASAFDAIGQLGHYLDEVEPALDWRIGEGVSKNDPLVWLPAPDGWAVWVACRHRQYMAVISRRLPPQEVKEQVVGSVRDPLPQVWAQTKAWLGSDPGLTRAWGVQSVPLAENEMKYLVQLVDRLGPLLPEWNVRVVDVSGRQHVAIDVYPGEAVRMFSIRDGEWWSVHFLLYADGTHVPGGPPPRPTGMPSTDVEPLAIDIVKTFVGSYRNKAQSNDYAIAHLQPFARYALQQLTNNSERGAQQPVPPSTQPDITTTSPAPPVRDSVLDSPAPEISDPTDRTAARQPNKVAADKETPAGVREAARRIAAIAGDMRLDLADLDLTDSDIHALRSAIGKLTALTMLALSNNQLTSLPEAIGNLTALTVLDLSGNDLTAVPDAIGNLTALTVLDLDSNRLTAVPEAIGNLTALTRLSLSGNDLSAVPDAIGNLTALIWLDLSGNQLIAVPEAIGNLSALTTLDLGYNQLTAVPESIGNLTALTVLDLTRNRLTSVPAAIGNLTALTTLDLGHNRLTALPEAIGNLTALTALTPSGNQLTALPEAIGNLTALTLLDLGGNRLTALPEAIGNLTALSGLSLAGNRLTALPEAIGNLTALSGLSLAWNRLTALPEAIGNLTALTVLDLDCNRLTALPEAIGNLTALTELSLAGNRLPEE
jgi:Leucine-rich repeat (LRR) protein